MELEQNSDLTLPLFYFDENLHSRDIESPDLLLHVTLSEELLAQLCQNPAVDSSVAIAINEYRLEALNDDYQVLIDGEHDALPEQAFYMVGGIEEAIEKAATVI